MTRAQDDRREVRRALMAIRLEVAKEIADDLSIKFETYADDMAAENVKLREEIDVWKEMFERQGERLEKLGQPKIRWEKIEDLKALLPSREGDNE